MIITRCVVFLRVSRLYTEGYFINEMSPDGIPEMQRSNLVSCVIQVCLFNMPCVSDSSV